MYVGEGFYPSCAAGIPVFTRHVGEFEIALREGQSPSPTAYAGALPPPSGGRAVWRVNSERSGELS